MAALISGSLPGNSLDFLNSKSSVLSLSWTTLGGYQHHHKYYGIVIGAIYIKKKYLNDVEAFKPLFFSQSGQKRRESFENNMKIDMSNTATNIIALNAAIRYISKIGIAHIEKRILSLTDYLIDNLQKMKLEILSPIEDKKYRSGIILFKARKKKPFVIVEELENKNKIILSGLLIEIACYSSVSEYSYKFIFNLERKQLLSKIFEQRLPHRTILKVRSSTCHSRS
jgi:glutamate/tyrosine decarboxylase-like PLP-dependent enzyme